MRVGILELQQPYGIEQLLATRDPLFGWIVNDFERKLHVAERRAPGEERRLLKHEAKLIEASRRRRGFPTHRDGARGWRKEIAYEPKKRTLAAAGRSEQRDELALSDAQADVGKRLHLAALALEAQAYAVEYDAWARGPTRRNRTWRGDLRERRIALPASFHQSISASTGVSMSRARPPNGLALIKASCPASEAKKRKGSRRSAREPESNSSTGHVRAHYLP